MLATERELSPSYCLKVLEARPPTPNIETALITEGVQLHIYAYPKSKPIAVKRYTHLFLTIFESAHPIIAIKKPTCKPDTASK